MQLAELPKLQLEAQAVGWGGFVWGCWLSLCGTLEDEPACGLKNWKCPTGKAPLNIRLLSLGWEGYVG